MSRTTSRVLTFPVRRAADSLQDLTPDEIAVFTLLSEAEKLTAPQRAKFVRLLRSCWQSVRRQSPNRS